MRSTASRAASRTQTMDDDDDVAERGWLTRWLPHRPQDTVFLGLAVIGAGFIAVNALFLQNGRHPAPIFKDVTEAPPRQENDIIPLPPPRPQVAATRIPAAPPAAAPMVPSAPPAPIKTSAAPRGERHHDPIADLIEPSNRTVAVQRALTEFGYGQIKPTGTVGPDTRAAIEKFERERRMPVTGQISERLVRELGAMKGAPL